MKTFLLTPENKPSLKWGLIPNNKYFEGKIPFGYFLAVCPSENIVILDVDCKGDKNGFVHIPLQISDEICNTFHYATRSGGAHYFIKYTGNQVLKNTSTKYGLDLRVGAKGNNCGGYVRYNHNKDIRQCQHLIKESSDVLNKWLETLFT